MKRPTWGTVIGVLMMAFGGCSVLNNIQAISLPAKLDEKKAEFHKKMEEKKANKPDTLITAETDSLTLLGDSSGTKKYKAEKKFDLAKNVLDMPESTKTWIVRFGYMGIIVAILYGLGGVYLLIPKKFSVKLAYGVLILSIAFTAAKTIVLLSPGSASGVIALTMGGTQLFSILIDIVLLSVVFASDKEFYTG
jgi:hypothetical protein